MLNKPFVAGCINNLQNPNLAVVPKPDLTDFFERVTPGSLNRHNTLSPQPHIQINPPEGFHTAIYHNLVLSLDTSSSHLSLQSNPEDPGDLFACYGLPLQSTQKPRNPHRFLVVLQALDGYVFVTKTPSGEYRIPLEPGLILQFNEDWVWGLEAPRVCRLSVPCVLYSVSAQIDVSKAH